MLNGLHLYNAFIQSASQYCLIIQSRTHSHTDGAVNQEQLGLGALLRDTSALGKEEPGIELATLLVTSQPALPPELLLLNSVRMTFRDLVNIWFCSD